jgi:hypothetical protein
MFSGDALNNGASDLIQRKAPLRHAGDHIAMSKPIPDKAEVALDYPDIGTFERSSRFNARLDATGIALTLERTGDASSRKSVHMHINHEQFAEILRDLAATAQALPADDLGHRRSLAEAAKLLHEGLIARTSGHKGKRPKARHEDGA